MCYRVYYSNDCGHSFGSGRSQWVPCCNVNVHNHCYSEHRERRQRCSDCQESHDRELDWRHREHARLEHIRRQEEDARSRAARHRRQIELDSARELQRERLCQRFRPLTHYKSCNDQGDDDLRVHVRLMRRREFDYNRDRVYVRR